MLHEDDRREDEQHRAPRLELDVVLAAVERPRQAAHHPARAPTLIVHPAVAAALAGKAAAARRELESLLARPVAIIADPARGRETFDIRQG